ncbi:MAG: DUF4399 domain-containing protein [Synechococcus sp.]
MRQTKALLGFLFVLAIGFMVGVSEAVADDFISHAPDSARVYISEPADGQTVHGTFTVKFGLTGMGVAPAGVDVENTGHHHLLVDVEELPDLTSSLPKSDRVRHYGGGQTETELTLPPGQHTLQLVLGNHLHIPHDRPVISEKVRVLVQ